MSEEDIIATFEMILRHIHDTGVNTNNILSLMKSMLEEVK